MKTALPLVVACLSLADLAYAGDVKRPPKAAREVVTPERDVGAEDPDAAAKTASLVDEGMRERVETAVKKRLLAPMDAREQKRSKFSRARMPPAKRRVRVIEAATRDGTGETFVAFSVDETYFPDEDGEWDNDAITGCVYPKSGEVFVRMGDTVRPAAFLAGKKSGNAPTHACEKADTPQT